MTTTNKLPLVFDARARCDEAETGLARSRGELIAMVRDNVARLPAEIRRAVDRLDDAEAFAGDAREAVAIARQVETSDPVAFAEKSHHARVSALVAVHIFGAELVPGFSDIYRWRVRGFDGKVREVANFAGDVAAIWRAELQLAPNLRDNYARAVVRLAGQNIPSDVYGAAGTRANVWDILCASPYLRALGILETVNVRPTDDPPMAV